MVVEGCLSLWGCRHGEMTRGGVGSWLSAWRREEGYGCQCGETRGRGVWGLCGCRCESTNRGGREFCLGGSNDTDERIGGHGGAIELGGVWLWSFEAKGGVVSCLSLSNDFEREGGMGCAEMVKEDEG